MADALTSSQLEILRRIRDGVELTAPPFIAHMVNELNFLRSFKLVAFHRTFEAELTPLGRAYLAAAERQADVEPDA
ncbi:MAG: hypothetical protein JF586_22705 [Burkholderiales bacterium]|jgi:hypothetical protein|nr:hypothetical protein [Burkholderiales bacterium]